MLLSYKNLEERRAVLQLVHIFQEGEVVRNNNFLSIFSVCVITFVLIFSGIANASSFPFRALKPGEAPPEVTVTDSQSSQPMTLDQSSYSNLLMVFFSADLEVKKKRSIKALKVVSELQPFLSEKNIKIIIVDAGHDAAGDIGEIMTEAGLSLPVYVDAEQKAYGGYGIFVTPALLLIDKDGKVANGLGYSRDLKKRLHGEIEIMLGEKDRDAFEAELHPEMVDKSSEEKGAKRHLHLGLTMIERGQPESALKEFETALSMEPDMAPALVNVGCLYIDMGRIDKAKEALEKGLEEDPASVEGQICRARIRAKEEGPQAAIDDLQFLKLRNSRKPNLHFVLGTLYEEMAIWENAAKEYRTAYELLLKKSHHSK